MRNTPVALECADAQLRRNERDELGADLASQCELVQHHSNLLMW